jgi:predicted secreted Zn-dependent protease
MKYLTYVILSFIIPFAIAASPAKEEERPFDTTSTELRQQYQKVNGAVMASVIDPFTFRGPHDGPGRITAYQSSVFEIKWPRKDIDQKLWTSRLVSFKSILAVDCAFPDMKKPDGSGPHVVYYHGPFGDIEFAIFSSSLEDLNAFLLRWRTSISSDQK